MTPLEVIPTLRAAGIEFVLVGAHGISGWLPQARATMDVDFLIRMQDKNGAAEAILKKFAGLELEKHADVWRFKKQEDYVIDLMLARAPLFKRVFLEFETIVMERKQIRVPKLEAALAMKFAAMTGHYRRPEKKYYDAGDFMSMVEANKNVNLALLNELGELVYPGGGDEVVQYVQDVRAGRKLEI